MCFRHFSRVCSSILFCIATRLTEAGASDNRYDNLYRNAEFRSPVDRSIKSSWIFTKRYIEGKGSERDAEFQEALDSVSLRLYGSVHSTAYWFADVNFGAKPSQLQSLIVDTGSSVTGFPCSECKNRCGSHIDPPFNLTASASTQPIGCVQGCPLCASRGLLPTTGNAQCAYHIRYTEGSSLMGKWYKDQAWLSLDPFEDYSGSAEFKTPSDDVRKFYVPFGCHLEETHLFVSQDASGILGLEATSRFGPPPFITSVLAGLLHLETNSSAPPRDLGFSSNPKSDSVQPVFSVCLSASGGILTIGSSNSKYHSINGQEKTIKRGGHAEDADFVIDTEKSNIKVMSDSIRPGPSQRVWARNWAFQPEAEDTVHLNGLTGRTTSSLGVPSSWPYIIRPTTYIGGHHRTPSVPAARGQPDLPEQRSRRSKSHAQNVVPSAYPKRRGRKRRRLLEQPGDGQDIPQPAYNRHNDDVTAVPRWQRRRRRLSSSNNNDKRVHGISEAYLPPQKSIQTAKWTPLVLDPEEAGGWPASYTAVLQGWKVKGTALNRDVVVPIPGASTAHPTRTTSQVKGLRALIDSGTTLTYLPFLMYADVWAALLKNIAAVRRVHGRQLSSSSSSSSSSVDIASAGNEIVRVSGVTLGRMKEKLETWLWQLERSGSQQQRNVEIAAVKQLLHEFCGGSQLQPQESSSIPGITTVVALEKEGEKERGAEARQLIKDPSASFTTIPPSAPALRRLSPVEMSESQEECWYLSRGEQDLKHFPDMELQFANQVNVVWRPSSYLYRKGQTRIYCLTVVPEEERGGGNKLSESGKKRQISDDEARKSSYLHDHDDDDDDDDDLSAEDGGSSVSSSSLGRRRLQKDVNEAVLGSTLFIGHDLVFHLGRWELAFIESVCPSTDLSSRLKKSSVNKQQR